MKIINRKKFVFSIILILLISLVLVTVVVNAISSIVAVNSRNDFSRRELEFINSFKKVEITLQRGDTSWEIQKKLTPKEDVRKVLHYVGILNERKMGKVKEGETLIFLKEKGDI